MLRPIVVNGEYTERKHPVGAAVSLLRDVGCHRAGDTFLVRDRNWSDAERQWMYELRFGEGPSLTVREDWLTGEIPPVPVGTVRFREWL